MKKILISLLLLSSFGIINSNAGYEEKAVVETAIDAAVEIGATPAKYDWNKSYKVLGEVRDLVNKYYYSIVFEKNDELKIYGDIENKVVEYNKLEKYNRYSKEVKIIDFINSPNNQEIINTLGYHTLEFDRYNDYSNNSSLFSKEHKIDLSKFKLNDKIDGLYLGLKISDYNKRDRYNYNSNTVLKNIYTKYNKSKKVHFTKIDLEKYNGKVKIDITKIKKEIDLEKSYNVSFNFYIKKGDNYIAIMYSSVNNYFSFDKYAIRNALDRKYLEENNPRNNYYGNNSTQEKLDEALNNKLKIIFDKIKTKKTNKEYLAFLEVVKKKIMNFSNDREKFDKLTENIKDTKSFNIAYKKYKRYKDQEKIVTILLVFISNEIYENTLEDTISDFIK